jgi:hypothetical protein
MTMLAHPVKPDLIGRNLIDRPDRPGGKLFRQEMQQVAMSRGSGWVDYEYENPVNGKLMAKTTYVERVDDLIICAGAYKGSGEIIALFGMDGHTADRHHRFLFRRPSGQRLSQTGAPSPAALAGGLGRDAGCGHGNAALVAVSRLP